MTRQPPQHQSKPPTLARSSQPTPKTSAANFRLSIPIWTQPLLLLGGAWIVVIVIALTALNGLLSPDSSNGSRTNGATIARSKTETAQFAQHQSRLPLWLFGAIALSCAAGSMLIAKQSARPPRPPSRPLRKTKFQHLTSAPAPVVPAASLQPPANPPTPATMPSFALSPRQPQTAAAGKRSTTSVTLMQLAQMQSAGVVPPVKQAAVAQPPVQPTVMPVTVVPPEETVPLDWGQASLADRLDLRKPRSVSSLL